MNEFPWSKFFWADWEADQGLRLCSLAAQGLWMRMLCICARGTPRGYLAINGNPLGVTDVARLAGISETEAETLVEELDRCGVFSRNRAGAIYSRRLVRDTKRSKDGRNHAKRRWSQSYENKGDFPDPNGAPNGGAKTQKLRSLEAQKPETQSGEVGERGSGGKGHDPPQRSRGSRLSTEWVLPKTWGEWATREGMAELCVRREADRFRDYWCAKAGRDARKVDWEGTWRNWIRRAMDAAPARKSAAGGGVESILKRYREGER